MQALDRAVIEAARPVKPWSPRSARITNDPQRLEQVEDRLFALRGLARKHETTCDALPQKLVDLDEKLSAIHGGNDRMAELEAAVRQADADYAEKAVAVSQSRQNAAARLDEMVNQELVPLKLDGGAFTTEVIQGDLEDGAAHGIDKVRFVASTNPGMPPAR